jgi:tRNA threonylcarbamoyladenosine biosynthesis protein TsaB
MPQILLGLETSGKSGSIALVDRGRCIASRETDPSIGSAKTLAPNIAELLKAAGIKPKDLSAVAVTVGPGSFTGLRVGVALAKTMCYALKIPTIPIDTLEALLANPGNEESFDERWAVLDAYRGEVFTAAKHGRPNRETTNSGQESRIENAAGWSESIRNRVSQFAASGLKLSISGPAILKLKLDEKLKDLAQSVSLFPLQIPHAREVALLGWEALQQGKTLDPFRLMPVYLRASAAEEKLLAKPSN